MGLYNYYITVVIYPCNSSVWQYNTLSIHLQHYFLIELRSTKCYNRKARIYLLLNVIIHTVFIINTDGVVAEEIGSIIVTQGYGHSD